MAKYQIERSCGHTETVNIGGRVKDRDRKAEWEAGRLCWDCYRKERAAKEQATESEPEPKYRAGMRMESVTVNGRKIPVKGRPAWRQSQPNIETASATVVGAGPMHHRSRSAMLNLFFGTDKRPGREGLILVVKTSLGIGLEKTLHRDGLSPESSKSALPELLTEAIEWIESQRQPHLDIAPNEATKLRWYSQEAI